MSKFLIDQLEKVTSDVADQVAEVYRTSFPAPESKPFSDLLADISKGEKAIIVARHDKSIVGFAIFSELPEVHAFSSSIWQWRKIQEARGSGVCYYNN